MKSRVTKFPTNRSIEELETYLDTLVKFTYKSLHKDHVSKQEIVYYPSFYLYRPNMNMLTDDKHIDNYKLIKIILRKVTNESTLITVKQECMIDNDWREPIISTIYNRTVKIIDESLEKYFKKMK